MVRLDVVAELAAHQHNLALDAVRSATVLVALPPAVLAALIAPDWHAAARAATLAALADELGGGDGPLEIVDLAAAGDGLPARLAQLWDRGIRALVVHGARDRPAHARVLHYRWPGALHVLGGSLLDAVLDPAEPIRVLAPGVVCVAAGVPAPAGRCVLAAVDEGGDPRRVRDQGAQVWPYAIDRARRLGGWAGVVPPGALAGTSVGAQLRARWDAYWTELGRDDVVRAAVLGLDPALESDLRGGTRPAPARRAKIIAITGIDGSGKSTQAARLAHALRDRGARTCVLKLYRQGAFLELANQLGARTRRGAPLAAFRVSRVVKLVDSLRVFRDHLAPALAACDAVIVDRYVETHIAAAESQLGWDLAAHPALALFPAPDLRFWLELDPAVALVRREARGEPPSADEHAVGLRGYAGVFARLARSAPSGEIVLDATDAEDANARAIAERANAIVTPGHDGAASSLTPPAAVPRTRSQLPCAIHVGVDPARPELGGDVLALRADLERWSGAAGIPEAFWLEAYAAQLVLEAITARPARAATALWPSAVAGMTDHGELAMLHELERMLAPLVDVESYDPRAATYEPAFRALGAAPARAHRLARDYADQLERVASARGWARAAIA